MTVRRKSTQPWTWIAHGRPERQGEALKWDDGVRARLLCGRLAGVEGFQEELRVGNGLLLLRDPGPTTGTKVTAQPDESGRIEVEIVCGTGVL
jgi:hypothetical protein